MATTTTTATTTAVQEVDLLALDDTPAPATTTTTSTAAAEPPAAGETTTPTTTTTTTDTNMDAALATTPPPVSSLPPFLQSQGQPQPPSEGTAVPTHSASPAGPTPRSPRDAQVIREGVICAEFLNRTASQLTHIGLQLLYDTVR